MTVCRKNADDLLIQAAKNGNIGAVELNLANGANVNVKNGRGFTPIHIAAMEGHKRIVEMLIASGANVDGKRETINSISGVTPLHDAAFAGHKEVVELLICNGAEVNSQFLSGEYKGQTSLDAAIENNNPETANLLRKHGGKLGDQLKAEMK